MSGLSLTSATFQAISDLKVKLKSFTQKIYDPRDASLIGVVAGFTSRGEDYLGESLRKRPVMDQKIPEL